MGFRAIILPPALAARTLRALSRVQQDLQDIPHTPQLVRRWQLKPGWPIGFFFGSDIESKVISRAAREPLTHCFEDFDRFAALYRRAARGQLWRESPISEDESRVEVRLEPGNALQFIRRFEWARERMRFMARHFRTREPLLNKDGDPERVRGAAQRRWRRRVDIEFGRGHSHKHAEQSRGRRSYLLFVEEVAGKKRPTALFWRVAAQIALDQLAAPALWISPRLAEKPVGHMDVAIPEFIGVDSMERQRSVFVAVHPDEFHRYANGSPLFETRILTGAPYLHPLLETLALLRALRGKPVQDMSQRRWRGGGLEMEDDGRISGISFPDDLARVYGGPFHYIRLLQRTLDSHYFNRVFPASLRGPWARHLIDEYERFLDAKERAENRKGLRDDQRRYPALALAHTRETLAELRARFPAAARPAGRAAARAQARPDPA